MSTAPPLVGKRVVVAARSFSSTDPEPLALLERVGITVCNRRCHLVATFWRRC